MDLIERLLAGPPDVELSDREFAELKAVVKGLLFTIDELRDQNWPPTGKRKLKQVYDFNSELRALRATAPKFEPAAPPAVEPRDVFRSAGELQQTHGFSDYAAFKRWLDKHPEIETERKGQRLSVHAGQVAAAIKCEQLAELKAKEAADKSADHSELADKLLSGLPPKRPRK